VPWKAKSPMDRGREFVRRLGENERLTELWNVAATEPILVAADEAPQRDARIALLIGLWHRASSSRAPMDTRARSRPQDEGCLRALIARIGARCAQEIRRKRCQRTHTHGQGGFLK